MAERFAWARRKRKRSSALWIGAKKSCSLYLPLSFLGAEESLHICTNAVRFAGARNGKFFVCRASSRSTLARSNTSTGSAISFLYSHAGLHRGPAKRSIFGKRG